MSAFVKKYVGLILGIFCACAYAQTNNQPPDVWQKVASDSTPYVAPSLSDEGNSLVFYQQNEQGQINRLYLSTMDAEGKFGPPIFIAGTGTPIAGTPYSIKSFAPSQQDKTPPFASFNGPMVNQGIITFSAIASDNRQGIFYSEAINGHYLVYPIAWVGNAIAMHSPYYREKITRLDAPYVSQNKIYYLEQTSSKRDLLMQYDVTREQNNIILDSRNNADNLNHFWNMSLYQDNAAIRAEQNGQQGVFIVNLPTGQVTEVPTPNLQGLGPSPIHLGGPSLFGNNVAFVASSIDMHGKRQMALYSNAAGHNMNAPLIVTGQPFEGDTFVALENPTLMVVGQQALISFEGTEMCLGHPSTSAYLLEFDKNQSKMLSFVMPSTKCQGFVTYDNHPVERVSLGPVSLRNMQLAMLIDFADQVHWLIDIHLAPMLAASS